MVVNGSQDYREWNCFQFVDWDDSHLKYSIRMQFHRNERNQWSKHFQLHSFLFAAQIKWKFMNRLSTIYSCIKEEKELPGWFHWSCLFDFLSRNIFTKLKDHLSSLSLFVIWIRWFIEENKWQNSNCNAQLQDFLSIWLSVPFE